MVNKWVAFPLARNLFCSTILTDFPPKLLRGKVLVSFFIYIRRVRGAEAPEAKAYYTEISELGCKLKSICKPEVRAHSRGKDII